MVTAQAMTRGGVTRGLALGGALAALAAGALTMTDRAMAAAPPAPVCTPPAAVQQSSTGAPKDIVDATLSDPMNPDSASIPGPVATSTINVLSGPAVVTDVDVTTRIKHQHSGDLRITLEHAGRTVVLKDQTTGRGEGVQGSVDALVDAWNGTTWDDQAGEIATDKTYSTSPVTGSLVPEGALGAFIGTSATGVWNLKVQDFGAGDKGTIEGFSLTINGVPAAPQTIPSTGVNDTVFPIKDNASDVVSSKIEVTGAKGYLTDIDIRTFLKHTAPADVVMTLEHAGIKTTITSGNGSSDDNVFDGTTWDDGSAGSPLPVTMAETQENQVQTRLVPEGAMAAFIGTNPNGVWTLTVQDVDARPSTPGGPPDEGRLDSWNLSIKSADGCAQPAPVTPTTPGGGTTQTPTTPTPPVLPPVTKLSPRAVGLKLSGRDRVAPYVITARGTVKRPAGAAAAVCTGKVRVTAKAGRKVVLSKTVKLTKACSFTAKLTIKKKPKSLPRNGKITVSARFLGNASLKARTSKAGSVRIG